MDILENYLEQNLNAILILKLRLKRSVTFLQNYVDLRMYQIKRVNLIIC